MSDHHDLWRDRRHAPRCRGWRATGCRGCSTRDYDPRDIPLRAQARRPDRHGHDGEARRLGRARQHALAQSARATASYRITGHKWFFSAPQCDAHLVLAQSSGGLSCFFMPRRLPDGSAERHLHSAPEGQTRQSLQRLLRSRVRRCLGGACSARKAAACRPFSKWALLRGSIACTGSAGLMRQAVVQALHHARHRQAFGSLLIEQPLMRSVLADMALESEAATRARACAWRAPSTATAPSEIALRRALTSAAKFWVCKRGCELAAEAMEVLGGNGYTEELPLARIAREMPVNSIWEGSGNIMCLDVLRAFGKSTATRAAVLDELSRGARPASELRCGVRAIRRQHRWRRYDGGARTRDSRSPSSRWCRPACCSVRRKRRTSVPRRQSRKATAQRA